MSIFCGPPGVARTLTQRVTRDEGLTTSASTLATEKNPAKTARKWNLANRLIACPYRELDLPFNSSSSVSRRQE
jgi:hypothetical protein